MSTIGNIVYFYSFSQNSFLLIITEILSLYQKL